MRSKGLFFGWRRDCMKSQLSPHKVPAKSHGELHHYYYHRRHLSFSQRAASSLAAAAARKRNHAAKIQMDNSPPPSPPPSTTTEKKRAAALLFFCFWINTKPDGLMCEPRTKMQSAITRPFTAEAQELLSCWFVASRSHRIWIRKLLVGNVWWEIAGGCVVCAQFSLIRVRREG